MATNLAKYLKNVGRSVVYSTVDHFTENNSAIQSFTEDNKELGKILYQSVKDFKGTINKGYNYALNSQIGVAAKEYKKALFEDIKTGNFYNKERISEISLRAAGKLGDFSDLYGDDGSDPFAELENLDFGSEDDFFKSMNEGIDDLIGDDDIFIADALNETSAENANAINMGTARSAEYIVSANKSLTETSIKSNEKMMSKIGLGIGALNSNIASLHQFNNEVLKTHVENSSQFYTVATEFIGEVKKSNEERNTLLKKILENQEKMAGQVEQKQSSSESLSYLDIASGGTPDLMQYLKKIKSNASNMSNGLGSLLNTFEGGNIFLTYAGAPLKFLTDTLVKNIVPKTLDKVISDFNESFEGYFGSTIMKLNSMADDMDANPIMQNLGRLLGIDLSVKTTIDTRKYNKGPMPWDGQAKKALVEVIPAQLSEIISLMSGKNAKLYDFDAGKFIDSGEFLKNSKEQERQNRLAPTREIRNQMYKMMEYITSSKEQADQLKKDIENMAEIFFMSGKLLDYRRSDANDLGISTEENYQIIRAMLDSLPRNMMFRANNEVARAITNHNNNMKRMESEGKYTIENFKYNKFLNQNEYDKYGNKKILGMNNIFANAKDKHGRDMFYYMQNIYKELSWQRDNWQNQSINVAAVQTNSNVPVVVDNTKYRQYDYNDPNFIGPVEKTNVRSIVNRVKSGELPLDQVKNSNLRDMIEVYSDPINDMDISINGKKKYIKDNNNVLSYKEFKKNKKIVDKYNSGVPINYRKYRKAQDKINKHYDIETQFRNFKGAYNNSKYANINLSDENYYRELLAYETFLNESKYENLKNEKIQRSDALKNLYVKQLEKELRNITPADIHLNNRQSQNNSRLNNYISGYTVGNNSSLTSIDSYHIKDSREVERLKNTPFELEKRYSNEMERRTQKAKENRDRILNYDKLIQGKNEEIYKKTRDMISSNQEHFDTRMKRLDSAKNTESLGIFKSLIGNVNIPNKVRDIVLGIDQLSKKPVTFLANILHKADERMYELLYGTEQEKANDPKSFIGNLMFNMRMTFMDMKNWLSQYVFQPIGDQLMPTVNKVLEKLGIEVDEEKKQDWSSKIRNFIFGERDEDGKLIHPGMFGGTIDFVEKSISDVYNPIKSNIEGNMTPAEHILQKEYGDSDEEKRMIKEFFNAIPAEKFTKSSDMKAKYKEFKEARQMKENMSKKMSEKSKEVNRLKEDKSNAATASIYERTKTGKIKTRRKKDENGNYILDRNGKYIMEKVIIPKEKRQKLDVSHRQQFNYNNDKKEQKIAELAAKGVDWAVEHVKKLNENPMERARFASGTPLITKTGLAMVSEGEAIIPAYANPYNKKRSVENVELQSRKEKSKISQLRQVLSQFPLPSQLNEDKVPGFASGNSSVEIDDDGNVKDNNRFDDIKEAFKRRRDRKKNKKKQTKQDDSEAAPSHNDDEDELYRVGNTSNFAEKGKEPLFYQISKELSNGIRAVFSALQDSGKNVHDKFSKKIDEMEADRDKLFKGVVDDVMKKGIRDYLPAGIGGAILGSGVSLLTGGIVGPLLGAAVGAGISITKESQAIQDWLFGERDKDGLRKGNILSRELSRKIDKYFPGMAKGAVVGGITSILPFVPGGPVTGIMLGSAIGFAKNNQKIMDNIFGKVIDEDGNRDDSGIIKASFIKKLKDSIPRMGAGAITALTVGPFGLLGNVILGSALGYASTSEQFKELVFGVEGSDGKKHGGILPTLKEGFVDPLLDFTKTSIKNVKKWFKEDVMNPIAGAIHPLMKQIAVIAGGISGKIGDIVSNILDQRIGIPLGKFFEEKVMKKVTSSLTFVLKTLARPTAAVISTPAKMIGAVGNRLKRRQIANGNADYMTARERLEFREEELNKAKNRKTHIPILGVLANGANRIVNGRIKNDKTKRFDEILATSNTDQLREMQEAFNYLSIPARDIRRKKNEDIDELNRMVTYDYGLNYKESKKLLKRLRDGGIENAKKYIEKDLFFDGDYNKKQEFTRKLVEQMSKVEASTLVSDNTKEYKARLTDRLRSMGLGNIDVNDVRSVKKYRNLIDKEVNSKTIDEITEENNQSRHKELIEILRTGVDYLKQLADPEYREKIRNFKQAYNQRKANARRSIFGTEGGSQGLYDDLTEEEINRYKEEGIWETVEQETFNKRTDDFASNKMAKSFYNNIKLFGGTRAVSKAFRGLTGKHLFKVEDNEWDKLYKEAGGLFSTNKVEKIRAKYIKRKCYDYFLKYPNGSVYDINFNDAPKILRESNGEFFINNKNDQIYIENARNKAIEDIKNKEEDDLKNNDNKEETTSKKFKFKTGSDFYTDSKGNTRSADDKENEKSKFYKNAGKSSGGYFQKADFYTDSEVNTQSSEDFEKEEKSNKKKNNKSKKKKYKRTNGKSSGGYSQKAADTGDEELDDEINNNNQDKSANQTDDDTMFTYTDTGAKKYKRDSKSGKFNLDESDSETKETLKEQEEQKNLWKTIGEGTMGTLNLLKDGFNKFFGIQEEEDSWRKKLLKIGLGIAGTLTALGAAAKVDKWWDEKAKPTLVNLLEPLAPSISATATTIAVGIDNLIAAAQTKILQVADSIMLGFSNLPTIFKTYILPFWQQGLEWAITEVIPKIASSITVALPSIFPLFAEAIGNYITLSFGKLFGLSKDEGHARKGSDYYMEDNSVDKSVNPLNSNYKPGDDDLELPSEKYGDSAKSGRAVNFIKSIGLYNPEADKNVQFDSAGNVITDSNGQQSYSNSNVLTTASNALSGIGNSASSSTAQIFNNLKNQFNNIQQQQLQGDLEAINGGYQTQTNTSLDQSQYQTQGTILQKNIEQELQNVDTSTLTTSDQIQSTARQVSANVNQGVENDIASGQGTSYNSQITYTVDQNNNIVSNANNIQNKSSNAISNLINTLTNSGNGANYQTQSVQNTQQQITEDSQYMSSGGYELPTDNSYINSNMTTKDGDTNTYYNFVDEGGFNTYTLNGQNSNNLGISDKDYKRLQKFYNQTEKAIAGTKMEQFPDLVFSNTVLWRFSKDTEYAFLYTENNGYLSYEDYTIVNQSNKPVKIKDIYLNEDGYLTDSKGQVLIDSIGNAIVKERIIANGNKLAIVEPVNQSGLKSSRFYYVTAFTDQPKYLTEEEALSLPLQVMENGYVVTKIGSNLVPIHGLYYDPDTNTIVTKPTKATKEKYGETGYTDEEPYEKYNNSNYKTDSHEKLLNFNSGNIAGVTANKAVRNFLTGGKYANNSRLLKKYLWSKITRRPLNVFGVRRDIKKASINLTNFSGTLGDKLLYKGKVSDGVLDLKTRPWSEVNADRLADYTGNRAARISEIEYNKIYDETYQQMKDEVMSSGKYKRFNRKAKKEVKSKTSEYMLANQEVITERINESARNKIDKDVVISGNKEVLSKTGESAKIQNDIVKEERRRVEDQYTIDKVNEARNKATKDADDYYNKNKAEFTEKATKNVDENIKNSNKKKPSKKNKQKMIEEEKRRLKGEYVKEQTEAATEKATKEAKDYISKNGREFAEKATKNVKDKGLKHTTEELAESALDRTVKDKVKDTVSRAVGNKVKPRLNPLKGVEKLDNKLMELAISAIKKFAGAIAKVKPIQKIFKFTKEKLVDAFVGFFKSALEKGTKKITEKLGQELTERIAKAAGKFVPVVGWAFYIADFMYGYDHAEDFMSVTTKDLKGFGGIGARMIAGFFNLIYNFAVFIPIQMLLDQQACYNIFLNIVGAIPFFKDWVSGIKAKQAEAADEVLRYNIEHHTSYSLEEYNHLTTTKFKETMSNAGKSAVTTLFGGKVDEEEYNEKLEEVSDQSEAAVTLRSMKEKERQTLSEEEQQGLIENWNKYHKNKVSNYDELLEEFDKSEAESKELADNYKKKYNKKGLVQKGVDLAKKTGKGVLNYLKNVGVQEVQAASKEDELKKKKREKFLGKKSKRNNKSEKKLQELAKKNIKLTEEEALKLYNESAGIYDVTVSGCILRGMTDEDIANMTQDEKVRFISQWNTEHGTSYDNFDDIINDFYMDESEKKEYEELKKNKNKSKDNKNDEKTQEQEAVTMKDVLKGLMRKARENLEKVDQDSDTALGVFNRSIGRILGFHDDEGNPLSVTEMAKSTLDAKNPSEAMFYLGQVSNLAGGVFGVVFNNAGKWFKKAHNGIKSFFSQHNPVDWFKNLLGLDDTKKVDIDANTLVANAASNSSSSDNITFDDSKVTQLFGQQYSYTKTKSQVSNNYVANNSGFYREKNISAAGSGLPQTISAKGTKLLNIRRKPKKLLGRGISTAIYNKHPYGISGAGSSVGRGAKITTYKIKRLNHYSAGGSTPTAEDYLHENLGSWSEITVDEMNAWINKKCSSKSSSTFIGHGDAFIKAANMSGLDPRYILAHAALETGWGTSNICKTKNNYFGINAKDSSPFTSAYTFGSGIEEGVCGGAMWIRKNYYDRHKQRTIYMMNHDPNGWHNYASDKEWGNKIASTMANGPVNTKLVKDKDSALAQSKSGETISTSSTSTSSNNTSSSSSNRSSGISGFLSDIASNLTEAFNIYMGFPTNSGEDTSTVESSDLATTETTTTEFETTSTDLTEESESSGKNKKGSNKKKDKENKIKNKDLGKPQTTASIREQQKQKLINSLRQSGLFITPQMLKAIDQLSDEQIIKAQQDHNILLHNRQQEIKKKAEKNPIAIVTKGGLTFSGRGSSLKDISKEIYSKKISDYTNEYNSLDSQMSDYLKNDGSKYNKEYINMLKSSSSIKSNIDRYNNKYNSYMDQDEISGGSSFISQLDPQYASNRFGDSTIAEQGCGPAAATMALQDLGANISMEDASNLALSYKDENGTQLPYFKDLFERYGANVNYNDNKSDILNDLQNGKQVVLMGQDSYNTSKEKSPYGPGAHYVLASGLDENGNIIVKDPEQNQSTIYDKSILNKTTIGVGVSDDETYYASAKGSGLSVSAGASKLFGKALKKSKKVKVVAEELNYRIGPGTKYKIKGKYKKGQVVTVDRETDDWYRVKSKKVWISKAHVTDVNKTNKDELEEDYNIDFNVIKEISEDYKQLASYWSGVDYTSSSTSSSTSSTLLPSGSKGQQVVAVAKSYIGKVKYSYGSSNVDGGYADCSAFTQHCFKKVGIDIPRTTLTQVQKGTEVPKDQLQAGDLVFFVGTSNHNGAGNISHVGIYDGAGNVIHCSSSKGVTSSNLTSGYYAEHYKTARRVVTDSSSTTTDTSTESASGTNLKDKSIDVFKSTSTSNPKNKKYDVDRINKAISGGSTKINNNTNTSKTESSYNTSTKITESGSKNTNTNITKTTITNTTNNNSDNTIVRLMGVVIDLLKSISDNSAQTSEIITLLTKILKNSDSNTKKSSTSAKGSGQNKTQRSDRGLTQQATTLLSKYANSSEQDLSGLITKLEAIISQ